MLYLWPEPVHFKLKKKHVLFVIERTNIFQKHNFIENKENVVLNKQIKETNKQLKIVVL